MSSTYDPALATDRDRVRSYLRDVADPFVFTDREIELAIETQANEFRAAAFLCQTLARETGTLKSDSLGDRSVTYRSPEEWAAMAAELWARGAGGETPYVGGISEADKAAQREDDDANLGTMRRGQFDAPGGDW